MAVSFIALSAASTSTANQSTAYLGTAGTCAAGDLLICCVTTTGTAGVIFAGTLSGGGLTWSLLGNTSKAGNLSDTFVTYWAYSPTAISITPSYLPTGASTGCAISCIRVTGTTDQTNATTALAQPVAAKSTSGITPTANPTIIFGSSLNSLNGVLLFASNSTNSTTQWTSPTGFTEIHETAYNTPANSLQSTARSTGATGTTLTWTNANTTAWATIGIEFSAAEVLSTSFDPMGMMGIFGI